MNKKHSLNKLLPVWIAVSAVFILAGIILLALLDFNYAGDVPASKTIEVEYGATTLLNEQKEKDLKSACEKALKDAGVFYTVPDEEQKQVDPNSFSENMPKKLVYTLSAELDDAKLASVKDAIVAATAAYAEADDDFSVYTHEYTVRQGIYFDNYWRGGLAIGVSVFVALIYVGIRFGVGSALTGLAMCANDALLTISLFTITRIPVYFYSPLIYAALAALVSVIVWITQCMKMKENFKSPEFAAYSADEAISRSRQTSWKTAVCLTAGLALAVVLAGAVATAGSRLFFLPALIPVVLPLYSSLVFGPALHVPVKTAFDKWKEKRGRDKGKKKTAKATEAE